MKDFPFPHVKYQQYKNTFLQNVIIDFHFGQTKQSGDLNDLFTEYTQSFFGLTKNEKLEDGVSISKKDLSVFYHFSTQDAAVFMKGQDYTCFSDTAIPQIFRLRNFLNKVVKVDKVDYASIRKINVWKIKKSGSEAINVDEVRRLIFSNNLLTNLSRENLDSKEIEIPNMMKAEWDVENTKVIIRTALLTDSKDAKSYNLLLDTLIANKPLEGYKIDSLATDMLDLNSILYDVYHWCINSVVLDFMSK